MNRRNLTFCIAASLCHLFCGCVPVEEAKPYYTPPQQAYVDKIMTLPLEVKIPRGQVEDAWGRAEAFISKYSDMKLQIATEHSLQTYNPELIFMYGYSAVKTPTSDGFTISVDCNSAASRRSSTEKIIEDALSLNAHILVYYVASGKLPFPELINRYEKRKQLIAPVPSGPPVPDSQSEP